MPPPEPLPEALDSARDLVSSVLLDATPEEVFEVWAESRASGSGSGGGMRRV